MSVYESRCAAPRTNDVVSCVLERSRGGLVTHLLIEEPPGEDRKLNVCFVSCEQVAIPATPEGSAHLVDSALQHGISPRRHVLAAGHERQVREEGFELADEEGDRLVEALDNPETR